MFYSLMEKFTFHKHSPFCSLADITSLFLISGSKRFRIVKVADNSRRDVLLPLYHIHLAKVREAFDPLRGRKLAEVFLFFSLRLRCTRENLLSTSRKTTKRTI